MVARIQPNPTQWTIFHDTTEKTETKHIREEQ
jgi:hypothetical protein